MFGWFRTNSELRERIRDLERSLEFVSGNNKTLTEQVDDLKRERNDLLDKIFTFTGITQRVSISNSSGASLKKPIGGGQRPWGSLKEDLEAAAKRKYWEAKKADSERRAGVSPEIDAIDKVIEESEKLERA